MDESLVSFDKSRNQKVSLIISSFLRILESKIDSVWHVLFYMSTSKNTVDSFFLSKYLFEIFGIKCLRNDKIVWVFVFVVRLFERHGCLIQRCVYCLFQYIPFATLTDRVALQIRNELFVSNKLYMYIRWSNRTSVERRHIKNTALYICR